MFFATAWTVIVVLLSVWPVSSGIDAGQTDKLVHLVMYAVTTFLYYRWIKRIRTAALFSVTLGLFMEVVQYFIEWRSFSLLDILFNCVGVMIVFFWYSTKVSSVAIHK